jgi:endoglucanase
MNLVLTTGLGENPVVHPLHIDSRFTGQPAPVGITVCGPCEIPVFGTTDNVHGVRINRELIPAALQWPSAESYFDVYRWASMNEYTVDNTMGPSAYIWGYLASRK